MTIQANQIERRVKDLEDVINETYDVIVDAINSDHNHEHLVFILATAGTMLASAFDARSSRHLNSAFDVHNPLVHDVFTLFGLLWYALRQKDGNTTDWKVISKQLDTLAAKARSLAEVRE